MNTSSIPEEHLHTRRICSLRDAPPWPPTARRSPYPAPHAKPHVMNGLVLIHDATNVVVTSTTAIESSYTNPISLAIDYLPPARPPRLGCPSRQAVDDARPVKVASSRLAGDTQVSIHCLHRPGAYEATWRWSLGSAAVNGALLDLCGPTWWRCVRSGAGGTSRHISPPRMFDL